MRTDRSVAPARQVLSFLPAAAVTLCLWAAQGGCDDQTFDNAKPSHDGALSRQQVALQHPVEGETCRLLKVPTDKFQLDRFPPVSPQPNTAEAFCGAFAVQSL